jgi:putative PIN family toxin of toxin-antitoxin system
MPKNKPLKLVIDTNLWISFVISNKLNLLDSILLDNKTRILFSIELINELEAVMNKPKLKKYFSEFGLQDMLTTFEPYIDFISVKSKVKLCRDSKDDFLLSLAKDGKATHLITGDKDLLDIGFFGQIEILNIMDFFKKNKI